MKRASLPPEFLELATITLDHEDGTTQPLVVGVTGPDGGPAHVSVGAFELSPAKARAFVALLQVAVDAAERWPR